MERITKHEGRYISINGCKSLYINEERRGTPASNAIVIKDCSRRRLPQNPMGVYFIATVNATLIMIFAQKVLDAHGSLAQKLQSTCWNWPGSSRKIDC